MYPSALLFPPFCSLEEPAGFKKAEKQFWFPKKKRGFSNDAMFLTTKVTAKPCLGMAYSADSVT